MDLNKLRVDDVVAVELCSCMLTCESEPIDLGNSGDLDKLYKVCDIKDSAVSLQKLTNDEEPIKIDCPDKAKQIMDVLLSYQWAIFLSRKKNCNNDLYLSDFQHICKDIYNFDIFPEIKKMIENQIKKINSAL